MPLITPAETPAGGMGRARTPALPPLTAGTGAAKAGFDGKRATACTAVHGRGAGALGDAGGCAPTGLTCGVPGPVPDGAGRRALPRPGGWGLGVGRGAGGWGGAEAPKGFPRRGRAATSDFTDMTLFSSTGMT